MSNEEFKTWLRKCGFVIKVGIYTQQMYLTEELVVAIAEKAKELK